MITDFMIYEDNINITPAGEMLPQRECPIVPVVIPSVQVVIAPKQGDTDRHCKANS